MVVCAAAKTLFAQKSKAGSGERCHLQCNAKQGDSCQYKQCWPFAQGSSLPVSALANRKTHRHTNEVRSRKRIEIAVTVMQCHHVMDTQCQRDGILFVGFVRRACAKSQNRSDAQTETQASKAVSPWCGVVVKVGDSLSHFPFPISHFPISQIPKFRDARKLVVAGTTTCPTQKALEHRRVH